MEKHLSALGENAREVVAEAANAIRSRFNGEVLRDRKRAADFLRGAKVGGRTIGKEARANEARAHNGYADRAEAELAALPIVKGVRS